MKRTVEIHTCDRCGKEIKPGSQKDGWFTRSLEDESEISLKAEFSYNGIQGDGSDLCEACLVEVARMFINDYESENHNKE